VVDPKPPLLIYGAVGIIGTPPADVVTVFLGTEGIIGIDGILGGCAALSFCY